MLNGFETQTEPLTDYEREVLLPLVVTGLKIRVGECRAITNKSMTVTLYNKGYRYVSDGRTRKLINHIRRHGLVKRLIATSKGYYVAETPTELETYIDTLKGREDAIREMRMCMEEQLKEWTNE